MSSGENHWHGAAPNRFMAHVAMHQNDDSAASPRAGTSPTRSTANPPNGLLGDRPLSQPAEATDSWWAVVAASAVHALGTLTIISMTLRLSTEVEHMAPQAAARLEEEGVADPDRALSDLVEQYSEERQARGAAEVVRAGTTASPPRPTTTRARPPSNSAPRSRLPALRLSRPITAARR